MTALDIYEHSIRQLPTAERLRLASMILNDIPPQAVTDYGEQWSDDDLRDFSQAGWQRVEEVDEEQADAPSR